MPAELSLGPDFQGRHLWLHQQNLLICKQVIWCTNDTFLMQNIHMPLCMHNCLLYMQIYVFCTCNCLFVIGWTHFVGATVIPYFKRSDLFKTCTYIHSSPSHTAIILLGKKMVAKCFLSQQTDDSFASLLSGKIQHSQFGSFTASPITDKAVHFSWNKPSGRRAGQDKENTNSYHMDLQPILSGSRCI